jgi:hypothetical protein
VEDILMHQFNSAIKFCYERKMYLIILSAFLGSSSVFPQNALPSGNGSILFTLPSLKSVEDAQKVERILSGYENKILSFNINLSKSQVQVFFDRDHIQIEDIMQIMWHGGYASFYRDEEGRKLEMSDGPALKITYIKNDE